MTTMRVHYQEGQLLRHSDLNDEQAYRIAMRRRHNISQHGWGIVCGLELGTDASGNPSLQPGMAVDGYGRELVVSVPTPIPTTAFQQLGTDALDVWLLYKLVADTPLQRGRWECGPGQHDRWREEAHVRLAPADTGSFDPLRPAEFSNQDLTFGPEKTPPDEPVREWPVYLGQISGNTATPNMANRRYVGLLGESVTAPSGCARMQVGSETASDSRRFAVNLADQTGVFTERLAIDRHGNTTVNGNTVLHQYATMPVTTFDPVAQIPQVASPWQIYHTIVTQDSITNQQLRFEIDHPGDKGDPVQYSLVITTTQDPQQEPCLSISADGTVIVNGNLTVQGRLIEGAIQADPSDPRFGFALLNHWLEGLVTASNKLDAFYNYGSELQVEVPSIQEHLINKPLDLNIIVKNTGQTELNNVDLYTSMTLGNSTVTSGPVRIVEKLAAGIHESYRGLADPPTETGLLTLNIIVLGVGPANNVVSATGIVTTHIVDKAQLTVWVTIEPYQITTQHEVNQAFSYTIIVFNTGSIPLSDISLNESLVFRDGSPSKEAVFTLKNELGVDGYLYFPRSFTPDQIGGLDVKVIARGITPTGSIIEGQGETYLEIIANSELAVIVTIAGDSHFVNNPLSYTIEINNRGDTVLADITLSESLTFEGGPALTREPILVTQALSQNQSASHQLTYTPNQYGLLTLTVTVQGIGSQYNVVSATDTKTVRIQENLS